MEGEGVAAGQRVSVLHVGPVMDPQLGRPACVDTSARAVKMLQPVHRKPGIMMR